MADFKTAISKTLVHEGGYQANPKDHANWSSGKIGEGILIGTKYGITALDMPNFTSPSQMENLSEDDAITYYAANYWKSSYSQITSQDIADKLFDLGVLFGVHTAVAIMQKTLEYAFHLQVDGLFGQATLGAIEQSDSASLLSTYKENFVTHAFNVAAANSAERGFLAGWGRRINS